MSRFLSPGHSLDPVHPLRDRDRRVRSGRGARHGHRNQPAHGATRHVPRPRRAACLGGARHRLRRPAAPGDSAPGHPQDGGVHRLAGLDHRHLLHHRDLPFQTFGYSDRRRIRPGQAQRRDAVHLNRHPGRDGHAAQPLSAFAAGAEPGRHPQRSRLAAGDFKYNFWDLGDCSA